MFMMIGSAEKAGSGVDKIMKGWETLSWKRPYPIEKAQPNKVELVMPLESLLDEKVLLELNHAFGTRLKNREQSDIMVLSLALTEKVINNERLRDVLAMHPADITHLLQKLCKDEFLDSTGHGRGTTYTLKGATSDAKGATSGPKGATSGPKGATSGPKSATPDAKGATSDIKGATSDAKGATSSSKGATSLSARMSKDKLRGEIIAYCSEWRTATEIAEYLGKTKPYIRNRVLPQMSDVLQMLFPKENHPGQKYKVKEQ